MGRRVTQSPGGPKRLKPRTFIVGSVVCILLAVAGRVATSADVCLAMRLHQGVEGVELEVKFETDSCT